MKNKILGLLGLNVLLLILLMGAVSASFTINNADIFLIQDASVPTSVSQTDGSFIITFDINNTGVNHTISWTDSTVSGGSATLFFLPIEGTNIIDGTTVPATVTVTFSNTFVGDISGTIVANPSGANPSNLTFSVTVTSVDPSEIQACSAIGNLGDLSIRKIDINNEGFSHNEFGKDDEWFPFDEIEVEIEVENDGNYDIDDIEVSWGIYALDREEWLIDFDDEDEFNLKDGKEETLKISFKLDDDLDIDLEDFSDDTNNYRLYVVANGVIDDNDSPNDGDDTCAFDFETAEIIIESDFVVLDNIEYPETVMCGETVQITADVWNIGDEDQDEVSVDLVAKSLGLDKLTLIGDIDAFDNDKFSFTFTVPDDAEEKTHTLRFEVWDEDNDVYENDFDEDESEFSLPLKVEGGCEMEAAEVLISASLESEAKAGKEMVIKATITNQGDELGVFTVNAAGFAQWASSYTADRTSLILGAGESADVLFTFDVKRDALGSYSFTIELMSEDNLVTTQPVSVNIESSRPFLGITGLVTTDNAYLWGIGLLNIILIAVIIIVAVRIARRK